jgi:hypothetical protein
LNREVSVNIKEEFLKYEVGPRYIGEMVGNKDIVVTRECGRTEYASED